MDLYNRPDRYLIIRIMHHRLISILKNIFPLVRACVYLNQAHQRLRIHMLVTTAIRTQPVFSLILWKKTLVTITCNPAIIVRRSTIISTQITFACSFKQYLQITCIHPPAFIHLKPVEVIWLTLDKARFLPGGQRRFEHVAQVMHGNMKISQGFLRWELWPEKVYKLISRTEFAGIKQEPFEDHTSLITPLHQFSNRLFSIKKPKWPKEIGTIVRLILILARMHKSPHRSLLHDFHGTLLHAK